MKTNIIYPKDKRKPVNLFQKNIKIIKKSTPDKIINKRYQNVQNQDNNYSNNHLIYESYNKKSYNGIKDPTLSGNNNLLIIKNEINPYNSLRYDRNTKMNPKIGITKNFQKSATNNGDMRKNFNSKNLLKNDIKKNNSNNNMYKNDFLKWNNIGYKEVKYNNNFEIPLYEDYHGNSNIFKSYQYLPTNNYNFPTAHNLGFYNSNYSQKITKPKYNNIYSSTYYKQSTTPINNNARHKQIYNLYYPKEYNNNNANLNSNNFLIRTNEKNINNYKTPDHYRSIRTDETKLKQRNFKNNEINLNKNINNNNNINNILNNNLSISYNRVKNNNHDNNKKQITLNKYNNEFNGNNKNVNNNYSERIHNKEDTQEKFKSPKNYYKNTISIYNFYKEIINKPKPNDKLAKNYYKCNDNSNSNSNSNNDKIEKYNKKISKIQAVWRGGYVRELMSYYWSLSKFKDLVDSILIDHAKKKFFNSFKLWNKYKENQIKSNKENI